MKKIILIIFLIFSTILIAEELFFDDFEGGLGNWNSIINSGDGEWLIYGEPYPNAYTLPPTSSGNVCSADSDEAGSGTTTDCSIVLSTPLNLATYDDIFLEFDSDFYAIDTDDICYVDISVDGSNWSNVLTFNGISVRETHEVIDISDIASLEPTVYIRFHSVQPGWDWWWTIDNVSVTAEIAVALTAPAAPTNVSVITDPTGGLSVDISWDCPSFDVEGNPLTELLEMVVFRDDVLIYTDLSPVIGGPGSYNDIAPNNGFYTYTVYGSNSSGNGVPVLETVFVGEDAPSAVSNLNLVQTNPGELSGTLTWINPTIGLNGGVLNEISGYNIARSDGVTFDLVGEATEYVDDTIPSSDNYWYSVQPYNTHGDGLIAVSNSVLIADEGLLIMEDFDGTFPPDSWELQGGTNWIQATSNIAGGEAPEANFYWSPSITGIQRLAILPINTVGATELDLEFKHSINDFNGDYEIRIETSSDGVTWNTAQVIPSVTLPATTENFVITTPDVGSGSFQIAWTFDGYSYNINNWYIDDVMLEGQLFTYDNDLAGMTITGNTIVNAGNSEIYEIAVKNVGYNTQTDYNVKLFKSNGTELASLDVTDPIDYLDTVYHNLVWQIPVNEPAGEVTLYGEVTLAGDENTANDNTNNLQIQIFPQGIMEISVGDGTETNNRTPISFQYNNSLTETIYFTDELAGAQGMITALTYYNNFTNNLINKPTALWLGETTQMNLTDGWIPSTSLTEVFNGTVTYPSGTNSVTIQLTTPYFYNGGNLVVMAFRPMDTQNYGTTDYFIHDQTTEHVDRTRYQRDDTMVLDPFSPPDSSFTFDKFANATFTFFLGAMGEVEGYVLDEDDNPLEGAQVTIEETQTVTYTDDEGYYHFGNVIVGDYNFTAYMTGYSPQTISSEVFEDEITQVDFNLIPLGTVPVSGHVVGSDLPGVGLENALVEIVGFENYQTTTDANGDFVVEDVYTNITYNIIITYDDYDNYVDEISVGGSPLDLGTIILSEIAYPPGNVQATQNPDGTEVELTWSSPGQGGGEFRYDDGELDFHLGYNSTPPNAVFGAVHPNIAVVQEIQWYLSSEYGTHDQVKLYLFGLDEDNLPNTDVVLYESGFVDNIDDEWNNHYITIPVEAYEGFFVGVSTPNEYTSIGMDDGVEEPWEFQSGTQFCKEDWTTPGVWTDVISYGPNYERNFLIRAYGINLGNTLAENMDLPKLKNNNKTLENRSFEAYNVYRFFDYQHSTPNSWELIAEGVEDTFYVDLDWINLPNATYQFAIKSIYTNGVESLPAFSLLINKTSASTDDLPHLVTKLIANYPNPFNPTTTILFELNNENSESIELVIYNIKGQKVKQLVNAQLESGQHSIMWNGTDQNNKPISSGVYFYRLITDDKIIGTKRMLLLK